jgi:glycosyltransferase involved in cell wall biosynthesis
VRVTHLITDLAVGGAELMLARLVRKAMAGRIDASVISLGSIGPIGEELRSAGVPVFGLEMKPGRLTPLALGRLVRILRRLQPQVLQTWLYHADMCGLLAGTLAHVPNIAWNIRCAELDPRDHSRFLPPLLRTLAFASRWPAVVICNSNAGQRAHERLGYRPRRWEVIPNGFDTEVFRPRPEARQQVHAQLGVAENIRVVGVLGRFHPMKDHATFLRAANIVCHSHADVHFVAAGRSVSNNSALLEMRREMRLTNLVHLLPERNDAAQFLAGLDVSVSSSYGEAFPNVVAEAMACGTPTVATDVGDSASIVGDAGFVVPPRNPEALAASISKVLGLDGQTRAALSTAARSRIVAQFSLDHTASCYAHLYTQLARSDRSSPGEALCAE